MRTRFIYGVVFSGFLIVGFLMFGSAKQNLFFPSTHFNKKVLGVSEEKKSPIDSVRPATESASLANPEFVSQTYNNCGPATLSMIMSMFGKHVSQDELASKIRPFNNPFGGVDDKTVFADEFVTYAKQYGFASVNMPNGTMDKLKLLISNDIPVVVRTTLHPGEDIGHFRIVRGYDDARQIIIQDDSYEGPNIEYSYSDFNTMWQPYNYGYILVYPPEKQSLVSQILGDEKDPQVAYQNSILRAQQEHDQNPDSVYPMFNMSTAYYYLGDYQKSIENYEQVSDRIPPRTFWYQIEPIESYLKLKNYDRVLTLTDQVVNSGDLAYSEMYYMRGVAYEEQGNKDAAKSEFEKAVYYNSNYQVAKDELGKLN